MKKSKPFLQIVRIIRFLITLSYLILIISCQSQGSEEVIIQETLDPTSTPVLSLTITPFPTSAEDMLSAAQSPEIDSMVDPSVRSIGLPAGMWFVLCRDEINEFETEFISFHPDSGSQITTPLGDWARCFDVYPTVRGDKLAYLTSPTRDSTVIRSLELPGLTLISEVQITEERTAAVEASWSPDGQYLAYSIYTNDSPGSLFIIDEASGTSNELISTNSYIDSPTWSPDGQWIAYREVDEFDLWGGAIGTTIKLISPITGEALIIHDDNNKQIEIGAWSGQSELLLMERSQISQPDDAGEYPLFTIGDLTAVSIKDSSSRTIFSSEFYDYIANPISDEVLVVAENGAAGFDCCSYFMASSKRSSPTLIHRSNGYSSISWLDEAQVYAIIDQNTARYISPDGHLIEQHKIDGLESISPDSQLAISFPPALPEDSQNDVRISDIDGGFLRSIQTYTPYHITWRPDSKGFVYTNSWGDTFYLDVSDGEPELIAWVLEEAAPGYLPFYAWSYVQSDIDTELSEEGPWLVYMGQGGLNGINKDGSGKTNLLEESEGQSVLLGPGSPTSRQVAVGIGDQRNFFADVKLNFLNLPDGDIEEVSPLLPIELSEGFLDRETEEIYAVVISKPSWSPSGNHIAFIASIDGPSSDLYVYDVVHARRTRLTSGANEALHPYWTPDGSAIIHFEGENLLSMSDDFPRRMIAIWAANFDGSGVSKVLDINILGSQGPSTQTYMMGWTEDEYLLIHQSKFDDEAEEILEKNFEIDLEGGSPSEVDAESITRVTNIDPMKELIFRPVGVMEFSSPDQSWTGSISEGHIILANAETGESIDISISTIEVFIWKPDSSGFFISSNHSLLMADLPNGELIEADSSVSDFEDHYTWVSYQLGK